MDLPSMIALLIAIILPIITAFIYFGLKLSFKNNTYGVLLLFIALNVFGLILGYCIISNLRYKEKKHYMIR
ncbi:hypothetical protein [Spiroplasma endosymbiont of Dasysyrphus albostriatus]|uniref:hypothetical protein n=1 Tax=Spiroplasma endosymbiont of Dasysyrphus albostriatus TaxID=3066299 RepID=UPI0030D31438